VKSTKHLLVLVAVAVVCAGRSSAVAAQLASKDDAVVTSTESGWVLGNSLITYGIGFATDGSLIVQDLRRSGDARSWRPAPTRDTLFRVGDRDLGLSRSDATGFRHVNQEVVDTGSGLELRLTFENLRDGLRARRVYAIYPQIALIETWTELESMQNRSTTVSDLVSLQLTVDGSLVTTVDGLGAPAETGGAFAVQRHAITDSEPVVMEEGGRSTQRYLPFATVASARGTLFVALMWSGAWRMDFVARPGQRTETTAWLSTTSTTVAPNRPVTMPHALLGSASSAGTKARSRRPCTATSSRCCAAAGSWSRSSPTTPGSRPAPT
jgi:hypothetical protein